MLEFNSTVSALRRPTETETLIFALPAQTHLAFIGQRESSTTDTNLTETLPRSAIFDWPSVTLIDCGDLAHEMLATPKIKSAKNSIFFIRTSANGNLARYC